MVRKPKRYKDGYDYVKVESLQRFNIDKREWTCGANFPLEEGEEAIVARNGRGMEFFFNNGFLKVLDENPVDEVDEQFECDECGKVFDSPKGLKSHKSQMHKDETNKKEESED